MTETTPYFLPKAFEDIHEIDPTKAEVDHIFEEMITRLEGHPIDPETEATMGPPKKPGNPIDPGYFTKA